MGLRLALGLGPRRGRAGRDGAGKIGRAGGGWSMGTAGRRVGGQGKAHWADEYAQARRCAWQLGLRGGGEIVCAGRVEGVPARTLHSSAQRWRWLMTPATTQPRRPQQRHLGRNNTETNTWQRACLFAASPNSPTSHRHHLHGLLVDAGQARHERVRLHVVHRHQRQAVPRRQPHRVLDAHLRHRHHEP